MKRTRKTLRLVALGAAVLALIGVVVIVFNPWNPMLMALMGDFEIRNESGRNLQVMPIGITTGDGKYGPLPRYDANRPPARKIASGSLLSIKANEAAHVTYDF